MITSSQKIQLTEEFTRQLIGLSNISLKSCSDSIEKSDSQNTEIGNWHQAIIKITQAKKRLDIDSTFFDTTIFLSAYEISYVSTIDRICFLYIKNGHDLHDSLRNKFAKDFEGIGKISTFSKFQFLKEHNLDVLVREDDNDLRNKIAHFDFTIGSHGKIIIQNKVVAINERLVELYNFVTDITLALNDSVNNLTADLNRRTQEINKKTEELNRQDRIR
jgi:hypothetical protein